MLTLALLTTLLTAQPTTASTPEIKVAYVDVQRAINEVDDGKAAKSQLKKSFDAKQHELDKEQARLLAKKKDFETRSQTMSPAQRGIKELQFQREVTALQETFVKSQQELVAEEGRLTDKIGEKLMTFIRKVGASSGYTMILTKDSVIYNNKQFKVMNITDDVVRAYNKEFATK